MNLQLKDLKYHIDLWSYSYSNVILSSVKIYDIEISLQPQNYGHIYQTYLLLLSYFDVNASH